ncbi:Enzymatic polyprotein [Abeliophyllum distichum]|uniref:Enzymatic polyprotein n=1 Tax=Abeliophyllum distichum TaxID=126358 RepID=A0ABD1UK80_9LAMI
MSTTLNPKAIRFSPKGETLLLEVNHENTNSIVPKLLSWDKVRRSTVWNIDQAASPNKSEPLHVSQIIEHSDGSVQIQFSPSSSSSKAKSTKNFEPSRFSTSSINTKISSVDSKLKVVDFGPNIPQTFYKIGEDEDSSK